MNNLLTLIKIEFSKAISGINFKKNKAKSASFLSIIALVLLLGIGLSSIYSFIYGNMFIEAQVSIHYLVIVFSVVATMMTFFSGINQSRSIFIGKDYDQLSALPLSKRTILASKVINLYLVELLYSSIVMIPNGIVLSILSGNIIYIFTGIILAIFISAFPLVLSLLFAFITSLIADRFKYSAIISILLFVALMVGIMTLSFLSGKSSNQDFANVLANISGVIRWINPAIYFVDLAFSDNFIYILIFIGINILSLIIVILVLSLFYDKVHELVSSIKANYKYVRKDLKTKGQLKLLLDIEFKRLLSSKMYLLNSFAGLIMSILMSGFLGIMFSKFSPFGINEDIINTIQNYAYFGSILIVFSMTMSNTCTAAISMEGNNFWLTKVLPLNYKKYMWAKLLVSLIIMIPVSLISSTLIVVFIQPDWASIIALYLIPLLAIISSLFYSLLLNLTFYKLKWSNEQEVVKSSASVLLAMIISFGVEIVLAGILIGLGLISTILGVFVSIGLLIIECIIFYIILNSVFEKKLLKIEEF